MGYWTAPDGVRIAYEVYGAGSPVILLHGLASSSSVNWIRPGVIDALVGQDFEVVAYDARGHGESSKPHEPAAYARGTMEADASGLIGSLGYEQVYLIGYSMGAQVAAGLAASDARVQRLVLGGIGPGMVTRSPSDARERSLEMAEALEAERVDDVSETTPRAFRAFADATGADRLALAAIERSGALDAPVDLGRIGVPTLLIAGSEDRMAGDVQELAGVYHGVDVVTVPGDHMSAVTKPEFAKAVVEFLQAGS